ncbi:unnamed protein product [Psylliodes chrysocephalus]|uniref:Uncharacterized protein n=1 Tax=Psylliodes chrysocephalus TaxID=3402493 RepID=A0A9P0GJF1_9CUCU|nr:unnamed protein product [Psylliodes chrysocephala]
MKQDSNDIKSEIKNCITASETRILWNLEGLSKRITEAEEANKNIIRKIEYIERTTKKNNIIIYGIECDGFDLVSIINKLKILLKVDLNIGHINNSYKLGKFNSSPIKIEFISYLKKLEILKNCKNLKGTNIRITSDLTELQREENKVLTTHLKLARANTSDTSYIKGDKLYVNNIAYTAQSLTIKDASTEPEGNKHQNSAPQTPTITREVNTKEVSTKTVNTKEIQNLQRPSGSGDKKTDINEEKRTQKEVVTNQTPKNKPEKHNRDPQPNLRPRLGSKNNK